MIVDLLRFLGVGMSLNKKVPFSYGPAVDGVSAPTLAHLLTPTSPVTGQIVQDLGCWLPLVNSPLPNPFFALRSAEPWASGKIFP